MAKKVAKKSKGDASKVKPSGKQFAAGKKDKASGGLGGLKKNKMNQKSKNVF